MSRQFKIKKKSQLEINGWLDKLDIDNKDEFSRQFNRIILNDCKMIKDCPENSIVGFYIETANEILGQLNGKEFDDDMWAQLKARTRTKLVKKYVPENDFDNSIDIYFNEVKREYILHPQNESDDLAFIPENRDIFIKNNLKLVIECAKRYRYLGVPFEDLIQIGNIGLLTAFDKFDTERSNLRISILNDIKSQTKDRFTAEEAEEIIKKNFSYSKLLDATLKRIPEDGFMSKDDFYDWATKNIKKASFASISFFWIRAMIIYELNHFSNIIRVGKSSTEEPQSVTIIRLDSINPYTNDNYSDGEMSEISNEEFAIEDESIENIERQNLFKELIDKLLENLPAVDRRIVKKKFGIGLPFPASINEIAESEGMTTNKVKYSLANSMKIIEASIPDRDKEMIVEMLK